jgi:hypothetical protein
LPLKNGVTYHSAIFCPNVVLSGDATLSGKYELVEKGTGDIDLINCIYVSANVATRYSIEWFMCQLRNAMMIH